MNQLTVNWEKKKIKPTHQSNPTESYELVWVTHIATHPYWNDHSLNLIVYSSTNHSINHNSDRVKILYKLIQILAFFVRPSKESKIRRYWNWYHSWLGRLALFFAAVNTVLGMEAAGAGSDWRVGYGFLLGIVMVAVIVLEVLAYFKRSEARSLPPSIQMDPNGVASIPSNLPKGMSSHYSPCHVHYFWRVKIGFFFF